ncbi:MAG: iron-containing alcohol dehydrogenase [Candidatus Bathyarchaeota archaeon]|nr:iron-containing alcohol dehydrogenase [Candidatus Bathyarchaeota archaeon]MDH5686414.1 iron-containing alcohol dehydrogenase [Candidatus Bathyarchaeota archaeon]
MKKVTVPPSIERVSLFTGPRKILFGFNSLRMLSKELTDLEAHRLLIVTDPQICKLGYVDGITEQLDDMETQVFSRVKREPTISELEDLASEVRRQDYDAIMGLGGGSVMDSAKIASLSATNPGPIANYVGVDKVQVKGLPLICAPTTSGTGSEVTRYAVIKYERTKKAVTSDLIIPDVALIDPALTVSMPPKLTAYTGLDALAHAIEAMISSWATPLTDILALGAVRLIFQNLERAYNNGDDIEARYHMSIAATTAGLAFNDPKVMLAHSIGQTIGPIYNIPHGLSVALPLPYMLDFYTETSADKISMIGEAAGVHDPEKTDEENARAMILELLHFYKRLDVPLSLKEFGVSHNALEKLAEFTVRFQPRSNSPIQFTNGNILEVYLKMWKMGDSEV